MRDVSVARMVGRAMVRRCPCCGCNSVFKGWFKIATRCPRCGFHFEGRPEEGTFLGALTINIAVTFGLLLLMCFGYIAVVAASDGDVSPVPMLVIAGTVAVVVPIVFYPLSKTVWAAMQIAMERLGETDAARASRRRR